MTSQPDPTQGLRERLIQIRGSSRHDWRAVSHQLTALCDWLLDSPLLATARDEEAQELCAVSGDAQTDTEKAYQQLRVSCGQLHTMLDAMVADRDTWQERAEAAEKTVRDMVAVAEGEPMPQPHDLRVDAVAKALQSAVSGDASVEGTVMKHASAANLPLYVNGATFNRFPDGSRVRVTPLPPAAGAPDE